MKTLGNLSFDSIFKLNNNASQDYILLDANPFEHGIQIA
jgi:hypothetical protein